MKKIVTLRRIETHLEKRIGRSVGVIPEGWEGTEKYQRDNGVGGERLYFIEFDQIGEIVGLKKGEFEYMDQI